MFWVKKTNIGLRKGTTFHRSLTRTSVTFFRWECEAIESLGTVARFEILFSNQVGSVTVLEHLVSSINFYWLGAENPWTLERASKTRHQAKLSVVSSKIAKMFERC